MLIRAGFDIRFETDVAVPMLALLDVRPERRTDLRTPELLATAPAIETRRFADRFGNICTRLTAPAGGIALRSDFVIEDPGTPDPVTPDAPQHPIEELPDEALGYLLSSRYCEVSLLVDEAWEIAGRHTGGWARVQALVDATHERIKFDYMQARGRIAMASRPPILLPTGAPTRPAVGRARPGRRATERLSRFR